jgi:hypothetical protein
MSNCGMPLASSWRLGLHAHQSRGREDLFCPPLDLRLLLQKGTRRLLISGSQVRVLVRPPLQNQALIADCVSAIPKCWSAAVATRRLQFGPSGADPNSDVENRHRCGPCALGFGGGIDSASPHRGAERSQRIDRLVSVRCVALLFRQRAYRRRRVHRAIMIEYEEIMQDPMDALRCNFVSYTAK